jgi:hypothetical protein
MREHAAVRGVDDRLKSHGEGDGEGRTGTLIVCIDGVSHPLLPPSQLETHKGES